MGEGREEKDREGNGEREGGRKGGVRECKHLRQNNRRQCVRKGFGVQGVNKRDCRWNNHAQRDMQMLDTERKLEVKKVMETLVGRRRQKTGAESSGGDRCKPVSTKRALSQSKKTTSLVIFY